MSFFNCENGDFFENELLNPKQILSFINQPAEEDNPLIMIMKCTNCDQYPIAERFNCDGLHSHLLCEGCIRSRSVHGVLTCPVVIDGKEAGSQGKLCGTGIKSTKLSSLNILIERSSFVCPFEPCSIKGTGVWLKKHILTCDYRMKVSCHLECGVKNLWVSQLIPHLINDHLITVFEGDKARVFLERSAPAFFAENEFYKIQPLGILKAYSQHFLVLASETLDNNWLYSVLLDNKEIKNYSYYCTFELVQPTAEPISEEDSLQWRSIMRKLPIPSQFGMNMVLSMKQSLTRSYKMSHIFQVDKRPMGNFFLAGRDRIQIDVKILRTEKIGPYPFEEIQRKNKYRYSDCHTDDEDNNDDDDKEANSDDDSEDSDEVDSEDSKEDSKENNIEDIKEKNLSKMEIEIKKMQLDRKETEKQQPYITNILDSRQLSITQLRAQLAYNNMNSNARIFAQEVKLIHESYNEYRIQQESYKLQTGNACPSPFEYC